MFQKVSFIFFVMVFLSFSQLVAAGSEPVVAEQKSSEEKLLKEALNKRFLGLWQGYIDKDFASAYLFESPDYRAKYSLKEYLDKIDKGFEWTSVVLNDIKLESETKAIISYTLGYVFKLPWGGDLATSSRNTREWVFKDGEWWRAEKAALPSGSN